jgi:hypothetical protein
MYQWLTVTGHFDPGAILGCDTSAPADEPDIDYLKCREEFLVGPTEPAEAPDTVAHGSWRTTARAPIHGSSDSAAVWTGKEMLVLTSGAAPRSAAYDPVADRWRVLPPSGLGGRYAPASVWTGEAWFIWGGNIDGAELDDGAVYDPRRDRWRPVADAPIGALSAAAVWADDRVLVLTVDGQLALYSPPDDTWTRLPDAPVTRGWTQLFWMGQEAVALSWGEAVAEPVRMATFDPVAETWSSLLDTPLSAANSSAGVALGGRIYIANDVYNQIDDEGRWSNGVYDAATREWQPFRQTCGSSAGPIVATSDRLITDRWLLDPIVEACLALPRALERANSGETTREGPAVVWTGTELILWSGGTGGDGVPPPNDGAIFRPGP